MTLPTALLLIFLIGLFTGLRSLTPIAITAWAARIGWLKLGVLTWLRDTPIAIVFTVLAALEIINDKRPTTPARTARPGARIVMSGLVGACLATPSGQGLILGAIVAIIGALAGTFGGYQARTRLVRILGTPDYVVAIIEDLIAIGGSFWVVSRF